ncbi:MAG: O-antigen ligase family protein [Caulobacterales bacterium]
MSPDTKSTAEPHATSGWRGWSAAVPLGLFFSLAPAAAVAGGLALPPIASLAALLSIAGARIWSFVKAYWPAIVFLLLFGAYVTVSTRWSPFTPTTLDTHQGLQLLIQMGFGLLFMAAAHELVGMPRGLLRGLAAGCVLVLAGLLCIEAFGDMALNRMGQPDGETGALMRNPGRGTAVLVVLVFGVIGSYAGHEGLRRAVMRACVALTLLLSFQFGMDANVIALGVGIICAFLAYRFPQFILTAMGVGIALWILFAPAILGQLIAHSQGLSEQIPLSWQMRLEIWTYVLGRIPEALLFGHGLDASRTVAELGHIGDFSFPILPLHPHCAPLQIWFELGLVGAFLAAVGCAVCFWMAGRALRNEQGAASAAAGSFGALAVLWSISYGAWQEWLIAIAFVAAALVSLARDHHALQPAQTAA